MLNPVYRRRTEQFVNGWISLPSSSRSPVSGVRTRDDIDGEIKECDKEVEQGKKCR